MLANQSGHPLPITGIASTRISTIWQKSNRTKTLLYRFIFCYRDPKQLATGLVDKRRQGSPKAKDARQLKNGAINVCYQVRCEDGFEAIVWFAALGRAIFCTENVQNEVAVINYRARIPQSQYLKFLARVIMEQSPMMDCFGCVLWQGPVPCSMRFTGPKYYGPLMYRRACWTPE